MVSGQRFLEEEGTIHRISGRSALSGNVLAPGTSKNQIIYKVVNREGGLVGMHLMDDRWS